MPLEPSNSEELVLGFLAEAGDEFVSGEAISDKLGLTRAAVWKHVESLRSQGYRIDAVPARGYRLSEIPDRLTALELRPLLNTHDIGQVLHHFELISSTNDHARELAEEGAGHGEVVIADSQTGGRGRRGRPWVSPPGLNAYFSVILRPELPPARAPELTLLASVAICDALRQANVPAAIKWPNDLLVQDRKIAGILTEMASEPERVHWAVIGIGVNVNAAATDFPPSCATSPPASSSSAASRLPARSSWPPASPRSRAGSIGTPRRGSSRSASHGASGAPPSGAR